MLFRHDGEHLWVSPSSAHSIGNVIIEDGWVTFTDTLHEWDNRLEDWQIRPIPFTVFNNLELMMDRGIEIPKYNGDMTLKMFKLWNTRIKSTGRISANQEEVESCGFVSIGSIQNETYWVTCINGNLDIWIMGIYQRKDMHIKPLLVHRICREIERLRK